MSNVQEWIDASRARADRAADHVASVAAGVERWTMKVPPADTDTDIMLIGLLDGTLGQALAALQAVMKVHTPIDALNVRYPGGRLQQVCTGCGQDDGNWNRWPCPTVQAIQTALGQDA